ncbi:hypothetical protein [Mycobacterium sherrisii]|uniref:Low molecular weight antigen MTB12-like C-terminal domain-containing protein n=1 Tax=Mycobacterium sherrisii TaxID=243061 RepID=A0A1E3T5B4_9MYCO|nr:hypothetical protein [Mycobacterium sherrisii]MCV7029665.1 hypothetical protein [Mycobacterium sherrisii]MEC4762287.1 hypothetical protein [Mycobacterium sherrisii]ODR09659.1 hypothetical protein BHQ21_03415 [Mycobacterium sherrisii]ORW74955.1 hypothetical protein AWC25_14805 [Mycobacterium sherrisii]
MKSVKALATGVAAVGALGAAALGVTSLAAAPTADVQLASVGAPYGPAPQDPPPLPAPVVGVPTADQLVGLLNSLADPNVSFTNKGNLVEGGISGTEAHLADHELKKAAKNGDLPLTFDITNIQPGPGGTATAVVAVSGPKLPNPVSQNVTFVNQGSWMLSRASAMQLLQAAGH